MWLETESPSLGPAPASSELSSETLSGRNGLVIQEQKSIQNAIRMAPIQKLTPNAGKNVEEQELTQLLVGVPDG